MSSQQTEKSPPHEPLQKAFVIFGGSTSERQVSLMSGTNVWLNLRASADVSFKHYNSLIAMEVLLYIWL